MSNRIQASMQSIRQLRDLPAVFRIGAMALLRARKGSISFALPDGRVIVFDHGEPGPQAHIEVHDVGFIAPVLAKGDIGFAESYMDGGWSSDDLAEVLTFFSENFEATSRLALGGQLMKFVNNLRHFFNRNTRAGARRNIMAHYDLGNAFYESWLDPTMTYSSALYPSENSSLEQAQMAKYDRIADQLQAGEDSALLEIGCGWGGFAEHVSRTRGSRVTCLTISRAQHDYARQRIQDAGLNERVEIRLEDYRDHEGRYDGVASIEMFEAVGEQYWPGYFTKVAESLREGGRAALQIITIRDEYFAQYRKRADFIQRYIFPGGMLPSEHALGEHFSMADLKPTETRYFGGDYARTLKAWSRRFNAAWSDIEALGFDDAFRRLWNFYLAYCEAGFRTGRINVGQFGLAKA